MIIRFTLHATERLTGRLSHLVTETEVDRAVARALATGRAGVGETHILIKRLPRTVTIVEDGGREIIGDVIWAVVQRDHHRDPGRVKTVMLRGHWQPQRGDYVITLS